MPSFYIFKFCHFLFFIYSNLTNQEYPAFFMAQRKNNNQMNECQQDGDSDQDLSLSIDQEEFNRIYTNQLKKKQQLQQQSHNKNQVSNNLIDRSGLIQLGNQNNQNQGHSLRQQSISKSPQRQQQVNREPRWYIYNLCQSLNLDKSRFNSYILHLPIFKKKQQILNNIINNQVILVTGQTGCGKSTQVPRLLYQYIRQTNLQAKIICVQPRRLAVKNLHKLLTEQIPQQGAVGYHIAMQTYMRQNTKILFMTNGIFLQRLVHGTQFFNQYPFIVLDQVHERDIDTDFILLTMKRLMRIHPKLRVILMSATIDNKLFQYYFAEDQIDNFMKRQNFYKKYIRLQQQNNKMRNQQAEQDGFKIERIGQDDELYKKIQMEYLSAKLPCPTVNVTQKGKYKKQYFYLDTLNKFFKRNYTLKWGSIGFIQKQPMVNKQLLQTACFLLQQIMITSPKDRSNQSVLIFLPGLGQIQQLASEIANYFTKKIEHFEIIKCHSSILNDQITKKLHGIYKDKFKVIIATNIAESSITVFGIKYIIDFCLTKQINFNQKSRMQNLQLVWASKASCEQRAGRTGRVCDGIVFRMTEKAFYDKLAEYSTPQIQRSSLDKLILRIKLIHENETHNKIFQDPGQVLGTAIQPPNLKNIDESIKSLILCGGLKVQNDKLILTKLGRIYVDIPLDILYSKMLVFSMMMGTYEDILILVCILSQNKNAFRKSTIQKYPLQYFQMMSNNDRCDFIGLLNAYKRKFAQNKNYKNFSSVQLDIFYQTKLLIQDVSRRIKKRNFIKKIYPHEDKQNYQQKFKITIAFGFLSNLIKVKPMIYDDRQEKRFKLMKKQGVSVHNTVVLLNSDIIRKSADQNQSADNRLKQNWIQNLSKCFRIKPENMSMTLGHGISFLHFKQEIDLNKFLFVKFMQKRKGAYDERSNNSNNRLINFSQILLHLGDIDYMQQGSLSQMFKQHTIVIDSYSSNRIIPISKQNQSFQFPIYRLLITNSITQHNSRLSCRYGSLLPDIGNLQVILYLLFYPFVTLLPDKKKTRYQCFYLKKRSKLYINYELTDEEIQQANEIRQIIKQLMDLSLFLQDQVDFDNIQPVRVIEQGRIVQDQLNNNQQQNQIGLQAQQFQHDQILPTISFNASQQNPPSSTNIKKQQTQSGIKNQQRLQKMRKFWPLLKSFIIKQRKPIIQQQKWQQLYFKQQKIQQKFNPIKYQKQQQRQYMNQIKTFGLRYSYFSSNYQSNITRENRIKHYQNWKLAKYKSIVNLQTIATDHDPYIVCCTCQIKIAKLNKIGPIHNQYFRELFQYIEDNVKILAYNELGDYFCSMLMTIYMQKQYDVYGCKNGHYLALKFKQQRKLKILTFSPINILYTDGTLQQQPQFQSIQYKKWREKFQQSKINKLKKIQNNQCFVCGDKFKNIKEVQAHIKNQFHQSNVRDFKATIMSFKESKNNDKLGYNFVVDSSY